MADVESEDSRAQYEAPALIDLGSISELTESAGVNPGVDANYS